MKNTLALFLTLCLSLTALAQLPRTLYVVNGLAETLSKINLETDQVFNHVVTLGIVPNQVVVKGKIAYVVNSISSNIQKIDLLADTTSGYVFLGAGRNPWNIALADTQIAYVSNFSFNTISKIDVVNNTVLDEFPIGQSPEGLVFYKGKLYVCNTGFDPNDFSYGPGTVAVYDPIQDSVVAVINVGKKPQYIKPDFKGRLQVICTGDYVANFGKAYIINPTSYSVIDSLNLGVTPGQFGISWPGLALTAAGGYSTNGYIYSYSTSTDLVLHDENNPILANLGASDVAADKMGSVYVACFNSSTVDKIRTDGAPLAVFPVGEGPSSLALYDPRPAGDANYDLKITLSDVIFMVNYFFYARPLPGPAYSDCNCSGSVTLGDIIYLVNYIFKSGPLPCEF